MARTRRGATRSRLVALGLSATALVAIVAGLVATAKPQSRPQPQPAAVKPPSLVVPDASGGPVAAEPAENPFAGRRSITRSGAS